MKTFIRIATATAVLALVQGCSKDDRDPPTTCTPTVQTEPDPAAVEQYCNAFWGAFCERSFGDCPGVGLGGYYPDLQSCRAGLASLFCTSDFSNDWYDATCAGVCVGFILGADCDVLLASDEPQACAVATGTFGPPEPPPILAPEPVSTITAGTHADTISYSDPTWQGGHARAYAIYFAAGQTVTIETLPPTSGTGIYDSVVHLLSPTGTQIGYNDDGGAGLYSLLSTTIATTGYHRIVVRGYSSSYVGSYRLSVTIY